MNGLPSVFFSLNLDSYFQHVDWLDDHGGSHARHTSEHKRSYFREETRLLLLFHLRFINDVIAVKNRSQFLTIKLY